MIYECTDCGWVGDELRANKLCPNCGYSRAITEHLPVPEHPKSETGAMREKLHSIPYDLVPFQEMTEAYVRVAEFGARKYAPWNHTLGIPRVQIISSLLRHTWAYLRGEERDKDSGLLHTDHILWNAAALTHNVHWDLADGRRVEPPREYKTKGENVLPPNPVQHSVE